ncbi:TOMM precursor leader peptide-binding protein [Streptomyces sp. VRA16 Mangrove soil]|uniref:TOMM precursor leader peptide-binding protein n=1 Tax=Streptomyces sp. VRA16 Mangrove soil TaxID=2817434 RepID=UPI001A9F6003|nr:TOMM precursor leader peptide-binding protein [Streptomyces sp. VRA16 Mangrove soil]MBO1334101.1 TOMM precursor leader peptide-binding protein [Streptomyces sp. VRA16 Mangrove soil]
MTSGGRHGASTGFIGFKSHFQVTVVPGEAAYLFSQLGVTALRGRSAEVLAPLLDGTRDRQAVLREAASALEPAAAGAALAALESAGLLRLRNATALPDAEAYWDLAGLDGGRAAHEVAAAQVRVVALPGTDPARLHTALTESGIRVAAAGEEAAFALVLCADYLDPALGPVNAALRAEGLPWLLARTGGADPWVGPVFRPDAGPCWACLAPRLRGHRRSEAVLQRHLGLEGPVGRPAAGLPAGASAAAQLAALETAKWLAGIRNPGQSAVHVLDTLRLTTDAHPVATLPQCPVCGDPELVARQVRARFVPASRPKAEQDSGGHRALTPQQMLDRYGHLVDPVTGIIKEINRARNCPDFMECYLSGQNLAMGAASLAGLRAGLRALSGGKGVTETDARTSALCEAVERYSGTRHGDEPVVVDSYRALGPVAVHPRECQLYADRQVRDRDTWNAAGSWLTHVPEPFDEDRPTEWTPVWSLTGDTQRLLPTSMLYFSQGPAPDGLSADSNGNAAGSSPEDALLQGFLELVERDAVALWWYNRLRQPAVDLDRADDPYVDRVRAGCRRAGREVWALDLTSDFGIPVVAALSRRIDSPVEEVVFGFGAHFDPRIALRRALSEMGQLLPAVAPGRNGSEYAISDPEPVRWWRKATVANQPYLAPDPDAEPDPVFRNRFTPRTDLRDDVTAVTELVRERGMELLVLDQTRPDLRLSVVKVIVPGMRHFWPRFADGRLFDVPVAQGRLSEPTRYADLNPIPVFV